MSVPGGHLHLVVPGHGDWPVLEVTHSSEAAALAPPSIFAREDVELLWHEEGGVLFMDARPRAVVLPLPPLAAEGPSTLEVILIADAPSLLHLADHGTFPFRLVGPGPQVMEGLAVAALVECACRQFGLVITTGSQCGRVRMILKVLG